MTYDLIFSPVADRDLDDLSQNLVDRILTKIRASLEDPRAHAKPLKGQAQPTYSLRIGDYRVLFEINDETRTINILLIRHRSRIYRDL